jgi:biotin carboxyl carrier protein
MDNQLFRQEALKKISSPEQLDELVTLTSSKSWLTLIAIGILLLFLIIWGIFGIIPIRVAGKGILIQDTINNLYAPSAGYIEQVAKLQNTVHEGQVVARIIPPRLYNQLLTLRTKLKQLQSAKVVADNAQINSLQAELQKVENEVSNQADTIISPVTGDIIEIDAENGDFVNGDQLLLRVERISEQQALHAILYFSPLVGKQITPGMLVQISPAAISPEEYGYLLGKINYVSKYPVTSWDLIRTLQSQALIKLLSEGSAPIEVHAEILTSTKTVSGYQWSSSKGPALKIGPGTLCDANVIISMRHPINLVLPSAKGAL